MALHSDLFEFCRGRHRSYLSGSETFSIETDLWYDGLGGSINYSASLCQVHGTVIATCLSIFSCVIKTLETLEFVMLHTHPLRKPTDVFTLCPLTLCWTHCKCSRAPMPLNYSTQRVAAFMARGSESISASQPYLQCKPSARKSSQQSPQTSPSQHKAQRHCMTYKIWQSLLRNEFSDRSHRYVVPKRISVVGTL